MSDDPTDRSAAEHSELEPLGPLYASEGLSQRHREVIRLAFIGRRNDEIADRLDMDKSTVRMILRSPLAQAELARLNAKAEDILVNTPMRVAMDQDLRAAAKESLRLNRSVLSDPTIDMRVRTRTASHFLDRIVFAEGPDEKEGTYREILRKLDAIDRNARLAATTDTISLPPGSVREILHPTDGSPNTEGGTDDA